MVIKVNNLTPTTSVLKMKQISDIYGKVLVVKGWA